MPARTRARRGSITPKRTASLEMVVDSPPGMTRPSTSASSSGRLTGLATASAAARAVRCSRTSPWRARTPMTGASSDMGWLPAAVGVPLGLGEGVAVDADHGLAQVAGRVRDDLRVVVEGGRLHDRRGALRRVAGLEDARAHEDALRAELTHQRGVGRGGDTTGGEQHDGQLAALRDLRDQLVRGTQLLGRGVQLVVVQGPEPADLALDLAQVADRLDDVAGAGLALGTDHRRALGDAAQR